MRILRGFLGLGSSSSHKCPESGNLLHRLIAQISHGFEGAALSAGEGRTRVVVRWGLLSSPREQVIGQEEMALSCAREV